MLDRGLWRGTFAKLIMAGGGADCGWPVLCCFPVRRRTSMVDGSG